MTDEISLENLARCQHREGNGNCGIFYEKGTLFTFSEKTLKKFFGEEHFYQILPNIPVQGFCFPHLKFNYEKNKAVAERIEQLQMKFCSTKALKTFPEFELEQALAEYAMKTGRNIAHFAMVGPVSESTKYIGHLWQEVEKEFLGLTFFSAVIGPGRLAVLALTRNKDEVGTFAKTVRSRIENHPLSDSQYFAVASDSLDVHRKRKSVAENMNYDFNRQLARYLSKTAKIRAA